MLRNRLARYTPETGEGNDGEEHAKTPRKSIAVETIRYLESRGLPVNKTDVGVFYGLSRHQLRHAISQEQHHQTLRRRHNQPDAGPDPQGAPQKLTRDKLAAMEDILFEGGIKERALTWKALYKEACRKFGLIKKQVHYQTIRSHMSRRLYDKSDSSLLTITSIYVDTSEIGFIFSSQMRYTLATVRKRNSASSNALESDYAVIVFKIGLSLKRRISNDFTPSISSGLSLRG